LHDALPISSERDAARRLVLSREFSDVENIGKSLLAAGAKYKADMRTRGVQQLLNRLRYWHIVTSAMELLQTLQRQAYGRQVRWDGGRNPKRMKHAEAILAASKLPLEQFLITNREQRASQRRKHRQL